MQNQNLSGSRLLTVTHSFEVQLSRINYHKKYTRAAIKSNYIVVVLKTTSNWFSADETNGAADSTSFVHIYQLRCICRFPISISETEQLVEAHLHAATLP